MNRTILSVLLAVSNCSICWAISTPIPTTQPAQTDTPLETILHWQDEFENCSPDEVMTAYACNNDQERAIARIIARDSVASSHLIKAARERWGAQAEQAVAQECQSDTRADDARGRVTIVGDHATITFGDGNEVGFLLIRSGAGWKMDVPGYVEYFGKDLQPMLKYCQRVSPIIEKATADVTAGKYNSVKQVITDLDPPLSQP